MNRISRRTLLGTLPVACSIPWLSALAEPPAFESALYPEFPAQTPARVKEMVAVAHSQPKRVLELLTESPALAKATWDWGFGDWETALGAASHVGNREIAELLIKHGARPDIFTFAMLGMVEVVQSYVSAFPGIQRIRGPHGLTLMHHARKGGEAAEPVAAYLEKVEGSDVPTPSQPLSTEEQQRYVGAFRIGSGADETLEVLLARSGSLGIRKGGERSARTLYYLGNNEFHPVGAEAVRIRFTLENGASTSIAVVDGPVLFSGSRI